MSPALVIGSASCLWEDLAALGEWTGPVFGVNLAAVVYPHRVDHFVTLHPEKLLDWTAERRAQGGNTDWVTWSREDPRCPELVQRTVPVGWTAGSSGLLAARAAQIAGHDPVILCGVPMDVRPHIDDRVGWISAVGHQSAWLSHANELRGSVFSLSGWTRELLGPPPAIGLRRTA